MPKLVSKTLRLRTYNSHPLSFMVPATSLELLDGSLSFPTLQRSHPVGAKDTKDILESNRELLRAGNAKGNNNAYVCTCIV